jgi:hypothetical protein
MRTVFFCIAFLFSSSLFVRSQTEVSVQFVQCWKDGQVITANQIIADSSIDSLQLNTLRFYLHKVELSFEGKQVWTPSNEHFLVDVMDDKRASLELTLPDNLMYDELSFVVGVDSSLQVNGAHSGVLDAMEGMYWTWQSGYIHWKLEAEAKTGGKREAITWHVGGYRQPFNTLRRVSLPVVSGRTPMKIGIDVYGLLDANQTNVDYTIMSPSKQAMHLADQFQNAFRWLAD